MAPSCRPLSACFLTLTLALASAHGQGPTSATNPLEPYGIVASARQLAWHGLEYYAFVHFGPNTFNDEEWGWSQSTPDAFNPTALDTDQWAKAFRDAGMAGMILTAKHHDGMALWDTKSTAYKVANSQWAKTRASQGRTADVVQMAAESARKHGLKFGVYLSPWDMHRDPAVPKPHLAGTPYDEPQLFGDDSPGDYNDLYSQQLTELVTMRLSDGSKVDLFEVWLDGASGSDTTQTFAWDRFRDIIREHQPDAIMWGHQGVDARWVGNEEGTTAPTNWHTIDRTQDGERLGPNELQTGVRDGRHWTPAEADARIRRGWFYHASERPKSGAELMRMYLHSVGRSVNLILNVAPGPSGRIDEADIEALRAFRARREEFFRHPLIDEELSISPDNPWAANEAATTGSFEVRLGAVEPIHAFVVKEPIALGQRIGGYAIDAWIDGGFQEVAKGTSIGYRRIDVLSKPVRTSRVRFRVTQANARPLISTFQTFGAPAPDSSSAAP